MLLGDRQNLAPAHLGLQPSVGPQSTLLELVGSFRSPVCLPHLDMHLLPGYRAQPLSNLPEEEKVSCSQLFPFFCRSGAVVGSWEELEWLFSGQASGGSGRELKAEPAESNTTARPKLWPTAATLAFPTGTPASHTTRDCVGQEHCRPQQACSLVALDKLA